ncbi:Zinc finger C2H2 [Schistosoma japonicum]|uniref:Zinc finger C2H2 n=1 Tax=Schistosoma japonicum TaxID=6182 RepID=A0A4Z2CUV1_SCHJA|nr:Zinc finger C2H2 [Schistosoma japonicum]
MKSTEDSSKLVHLNSIPNQTVKEYGTPKNQKRHSFVGNVCNVVSKKTINEFKEIQSDKQVAFTLIGAHSSLSSSSEFPQKARRSLLDWDSFINLPKKPRNLSLTTDDSLRPLPTKIAASGSPIKLKHEGNKRESSCLSPVKGNELTENVKLTSLKCYTEQDRVFINNGYSSSEERSKGIFTKEEESSNLTSTSYVASGVAAKNPIKTRRRRLSLFITGPNESKALLDQLDILSRKRNHKQIHAHKHKKSKLSPVQICETNETLVSVTKQNLCNGVQSPNSHIDTGDSIRFEKATCQSLSATCNLHENHKFAKDSSSQVLLNLTELMGNKSSSSKAVNGSQQNYSSTRNSLTVTHFEIQPSSLQKSHKLPKDLIATHSHGNLTNKTVFHCLYCTHQFSEKRLRLKHMVACQLAPKHLTKKKLFEISQTYESSSISSQCSNLVNNVDDEISISNGVICQVNQTLQNKHLNGTGKFVGDRNPLRIPYQNHLKVDHAIDLKSKPDTPVRSSTTYSLNNPDNLLVRNPHPFIDISSFNDICTKPSEGHLFSGNNQLYESDENIWRNYRPSYNGPYTCSFCYRVIHNRSNFARHMAACKTRISLSTSYTPSPKTSSRKNKHKCHFMFKSSHKVKSQSENLKKQSSRSRKLHTELSEVNQDLNADLDSNENVVNSEEKLQDVSDLSLFDKEVAGLRDSEGSQRGCIEEVPIVTEFHENDSTEDGQENRMSPSRTGEPDASTTSLLVVNEQNVFNVNGTPNVFTCFTCSSSYRHRASLLRHGRVSRHKVDPDLNADMDSNENVVNSEEKLQDVSDLSLFDKEVAGLRDSEGSQRGCIEEVPIVTEFHENDSTEDGQENRMSPSRTGEPDASTTSLLVVNEQNVFNVNGTPNVFTCFTCSSSYRHRASLLRHGRVSRHKVDNCRILNGTRVVSIVCPVNGSKDCLKGRSVKNRVLSNLCAKKCGQSESLDRGVDDRQQNAHLSEVHNTDNYSLASEISTKPSKTASYTSSSSDIMDEPLKIDHASNRSADKSMRASEFVNCLTTGVLKVKQTSEMNPLTSNPTMLTGKPYSLGLRRRLSVQSDQSTPITSKLNRRENRSASPYSLRHPRIEEEISKCSRRSSVSTQSLSDNLIDDVKSIISNATTIPASDHNFKNIVPPPSVVFTCSWCNRTGFKCFRYLQIHRARCSSRPSWLNKQKPVLSTNNNKKIKTPTICEQCHREFRSIHGLKVHQNLGCHKKSIHIHDEASLFSSSSSQSMACPGCPPNALLFESTDQLLKHLLTLKSSTGSNHTNRSQYWPTVLSVPNLGYGCHICGILLASESRLDKHKKACHEAWLFEEQQNISPNKRFSNS